MCAFLASHDIPFVRHAHPPVFTCDEELHFVPGSGAARTKNLFLRDKRGRRHLLLVTSCERSVDIAAFAAQAGADRLSFASPERLQRFLGVAPGSVSVLGLANDFEHGVEVFFDAEVWEAPTIHAHPLRNDHTLVLTHEAVERFLAVTGHRHRVVVLE